MSEDECKEPLRARLRWWLYTKCFAYCVRCVHPDADPNEFCIMDMTAFVAVSKDEIQEIIEEAPDVAWRFGVEAV